MVRLPKYHSSLLRDNWKTQLLMPGPRRYMLMLSRRVQIVLVL